MFEGKVFVCNINPGEVRTMFVESMLAMLEHDRQHWQRIHSFKMLTFGPSLGVGRNLLVDEFFKTDAEWMLMVDSDMTFPPDALDRLALHAHKDKRPIVGGLCMSKDNKPVIKKWITAYTMGSAEFAPTDGQVVRVDGTGAAFLLVHRSALETMKAKAQPLQPYWFGEMCMGGKDRQVLGEDTGFCARAGLAGLPIYVVRGVGIGHEKHVIFSEGGLP
jgi:GT2 family glycosyltransferase